MNAVNEPGITTLRWPQEGGSRVPYQVFTDPAIYNLEQERLFRGPSWNFLGLEAEVAHTGDYKSTYLGDTPVVLTRGQDGTLHAFVNRCAHRGALVCRDLQGNATEFLCVYHQWAYGLEGDLIGVPFRRGLAGKGGMPSDFDMKEHPLRKVRVESYRGLVFGTLDGEMESVSEYLGPMIREAVDRIFNRPIEILGNQRQLIAGNWKLYAENTRDPYHASLLHLFHCTFGLYRSSQTGCNIMDKDKKHSMLTAAQGTDEGKLDEYEDTRTFQSDFTLEDTSLLAGFPEFADGVTLVILALFPGLVVQQIANTLAVRQILPKGVDRFELVWTQFGYADDSAEVKAYRLKQGNLIGPAGLISMEDGEVVEIVQRAVIRDQSEQSYIGMGGGTSAGADHLVTETAIVGFWESYRDRMGFLG